MAENFKVTDRRRVSATGEIRGRAIRDQRPRVSFTEFRKPANNAFRHYSVHLRRGVRDEALTPPAFWMLVHGLLCSSFDCFAGIVTLNADKATKRLGLQATVLVRSLMEAYGNLMALAERPTENVRLFERDHYLNQYRQLKAMKQIRAGRKGWDEVIERNEKTMTRLATMFGLRPEEAGDPESHPDIKPWPTPYYLFNARSTKVPALLQGERAATFGDLYELWYAHLSGIAHQRFAAAAQAWIAEDPDSEFDASEQASEIVMHTLLFLGCVLAEVQAIAQERGAAIPNNVHVVALWTLLRVHYNETDELLKRRYGRVLGIA